MTESVGFRIEDLIGPISEDLEQVEKRLLSEAEPVQGSIHDMNQYVHNSGGKRIRPALLLYISRLLGGNRDSARLLAVIVEYIHAATLVHDDVIDESETRRGRKSLNALHHNKEAVLFGDWLYMTSFWKALEMQDFVILQTLISVTRQMVEGELLQMEMSGSPDISEETRERITRCKTAGLFSGSCRLGAQAARATEKVEYCFAEFGEFLGMAFQLVDDMLDYTSREQELGKPVLQDLDEGNITLPLIYLLREGDRDERSFVRAAIEGGGPDLEARNRIIELIGKYGCLERTREKAEFYASSARESLDRLPAKMNGVPVLISLTEWIVNRTF